jgi:site-specific recombinase XerC
MGPRHLTDLQLGGFTARVHSEKQPYRIIIGVMLYAGTRLAETLSIAWCDLLHNGDVKDALIIDATIAKSRRERTVPISRVLHEEIRVAWHLFAQPKGIRLPNSIGSRSRDGKPITPRTVQRRVEVIGRAALGMKVTPHMLRHTFATRLLKVTNIRAVQQALGHASLNTTQIYTHPTTDELREAVDAVDPAPKPADLDNDNTQRIEYG